MSQALGSRGELLVDLFNTMEWLEEREKFAHLVMQCVTINKLCYRLSSTGGDVLQRVSTLKLRLSKYMKVRCNACTVIIVSYTTRIFGDFARVSENVGSKY